nr:MULTISPECIES: LCP family protein [unclassified Ornithinimicrobium]
MMLLHLPDSGDPVLISIPRDSYLEIPGNGSNKLNAAYTIGGPPLLVDTIEQSTGLRIDGYLEIGFGGFVEVVSTVGGVEMCLDEPVSDEKTRLDLPAGCQVLEGAEALNYVRMRYADPRGDLGRVERQREFLAALTHEMATPGTILVPWRLKDVGTATGSAMAIGQDTSMWETGRMALGMRSISNGKGQSLTVPIGDANYSTHAGSSVLWDEVKAGEMFEALRNGDPLSIEP